MSYTPIGNSAGQAPWVPVPMSCVVLARQDNRAVLIRYEYRL